MRHSVAQDIQQTVTGVTGIWLVLTV